MISKLNGNLLLKYYRTIMILIIGAVISVSGWVFSEVRDIPETLNKYAKKEEVFRLITKEDRKIEKLQKSTNKKLDDLNEEVSELNIFLRDYFSSGGSTTDNTGD